MNTDTESFLGDALGSVRQTTDASGNVVGEMRYYASGETRLATGNMFTDRLFTGQREITGLGIYQFGARFYSPTLGRFLSADPMGQNIADPQRLNRFTYALNNPIRFNDPTGFIEACGVYSVDCEEDYSTPPTYDNGGRGGDTGSGESEDGGGGSTSGSGGGTTLTSAIAPNITYLTGPINNLYATQSQSPSCPSCILTGGALIIVTGSLELMLGITAVAAVYYFGPAAIPAIGLVVLPTEAVLANITLIGIEYIAQGENRYPEYVDIDYLPLIHVFTNPDESEYFR